MKLRITPREVIIYNGYKDSHTLEDNADKVVVVRRGLLSIHSSREQRSE